jgi:hypothetical protein
MRWLAGIAALWAALVVAACAPVAQPVGRAVAEPAIGVAVDPAAPGLQPFPECQTDEYAFVGESSLAALGLADDLGGGPDASRVGMIWVTANPVTQPQPVPVGGGKLGDQPAQRWVCVQWPDGSGMGGSVPDEWVPPESAVTAVATEAQEIPLGTLAVLVGAVVLIGFSFVAFRREGGPSAGEPSSV